MIAYNSPDKCQNYVSFSQYSQQPLYLSNTLTPQPLDYIAARERSEKYQDSPHQSEDARTSSNISDQVFGRQLRFANLNLDRLNTLLYQRSQLHYKHLSDIAHRHMKSQESLSDMKLLAPKDDSRRWAGLESMLAQLESEQRREDVAFWRDAADIRNSLFESLTEYQKVKDRTTLLDSLIGTSAGGEND